MDGSGITLDDRVGSRHYSLYLPGSTVARLDFGDAAWLSHDDRLIGAEIKTVGDAVNCLYSGRLADFQIPGLRSTYDSAYLIIEGIWRAEPTTGILQRYKGELGKWGSWYDVVTGQKRLLYSAFTNWLETLSEWGGVSLRSTPGPAETASLLASLCTWWGRSAHQSFKVMQEPSGNGASLTRPTMLRRMLALVPGVGWERSGILQRRFTGVKFLPDGDKPESWFIERQIASKAARKILEACDDTETKAAE